MRQWESSMLIRRFDEVKSGASDNGFDSGEEPEDEYNLDYNPSRDR